MNISTNSPDIHQKQGHELSKKLYRSISEQAKRLDDARSCARHISDLFTPNLQIQRRKFCDYCERLIFSEPQLYSKKSEELLWRKAFYDVVSTAKKLKKAEYTLNDLTNIRSHINAGIGFYHHFILKIQSEFGLNLNNIIDFPIDFQNSKKEIEEWSGNSIHQSLIYLGDLNRYKTEIFTETDSNLAFRYYLQAISFRPDFGMPHNQMGTLELNQNNNLNAVYHYMRCLCCKFPFEGTINNLQGLFEKNSKFLEQLPQVDDQISCSHVKRFIARFLLLIDIWYFNKKVSKVYNLCHQTYKDLEECLSSSSKTNSSCESPSSESPELLENTELLTPEILFKIVVICLLCISKLQKTPAQQLSTVVAFTLAIYSQLIQNISNHINESVLNYPLVEIEVKIESNGIIKNLLNGSAKKKRSRSKLRRRKAAVKIDSESEDEEVVDNNSSDEDSFASDAEILAESSDDEEVANLNQANGENCGKQKEEVDVIKKVQKMDGNVMLEIIAEETSLQCIKIINDWLINDVDIIKSCGTNTRSLLRQITNLLNLININLNNNNELNGVNLNLKEVIKNTETVPLSEDIILKGVDILDVAHGKIDWNFMEKRALNLKEEAVIRIVKMMNFGKFLTGIEETGVSFNEEGNIFICKDNEDDVKETNTTVDEFEQEVENESIIKDNSGGGVGVVGETPITATTGTTKGGQLLKMKHMGQLWLASEVRALESRVRGKSSLSPYLVLDSDALIKYTFMVKHFVHSRKFIVLIPSAVVSALDDLKREQSEARDAIRWLESQFHRGNRFFRSQRPHERAPIPYIKYPKKKDKEMCLYIHIIECCHYLSEQQKGASNVVTLLIGNQNVLTNGENKEFSYVGLAESAGVAIESITHFYGKWKKNYKGKR